MPQAAPRFSDAQLSAAIDAGESVTDFAARFGVTPGLVGSRLRRIRIARGEAVQASGDFSWDDKLRVTPSREAVERLYRTHGADAVEGLWGRDIGHLRKLKLPASTATRRTKRESLESG